MKVAKYSLAVYFMPRTNYLYGEPFWVPDPCKSRDNAVPIPTNITFEWPQYKKYVVQ
jgi:hypothetical protein